MPDETSIISTSLDDAKAEIAALKARISAHIGGDYTSVAQNVGHPGAPILYQHVNGPSRMSADATHAATFYVEFDSDVLKLYKSKLSFRLSAVRSNVSASTSTAGGSSTPTSSGGSAHTHTLTPSLTGDSGGGSTSGGGASHSHSVSGQAAAATSGIGGLLAWSADGAAASTGSAGTGASGAPSVASTQDVSAGHTHTFTGSPTDDQSGGHTHSLNSHTHTGPSHTHANAGTIEAAAYSDYIAHTHTVSGATTTSESTHTHTTPNHAHTISGGVTAANESTHSHTVTIGTHTHTLTLTYGIYEGAAASNPNIAIAINGVSVTTALGGPWDATQSGLDITEYLRDHNHDPLRQANTIAFSSDELLDIEYEVRSLCATVSPLGLAI